MSSKHLCEDDCLEDKIEKIDIQDKQGYYYLKGMIDALSERLDKIEEGKKDDQSKKPYKCPVCEGKRRELNIMPNGGYFESECKSCEGKGIVWGST